MKEHERYIINEEEIALLEQTYRSTAGTPIRGFG